MAFLFLLSVLFSSSSAESGTCEPVFCSPSRINYPVHGLFESIQIDPRLNDIILETERVDDGPPNGPLVASNFTTYIWVRNEKTGSWNLKGEFLNSYFYQEQTFSHLDAKLSEDAPRFIDVPNVRPLVPGRGVPLQAYTNLQHMRLAQIRPGEIATIETSHVVNSRTLQEIEQMEPVRAWLHEHGYKPVPFEEISKVIRQTHTGLYIQTVAVQSKHRIKSAHVEPFQFDYKKDTRVIRPFIVVFELESWIPPSKPGN